MDTRAVARRILLHGLAMVMAALLWGVAVPHVPFPRLGLVAHVQMASNGLLFVVMALLLLLLPNGVGPRAARVMLASAWLAWAMLLSQVANAWWGTREILPIAAQQAGAGGGLAWQEAVVTLAHVAGGLGLLVAWALLLVGFAARPAAER